MSLYNLLFGSNPNANDILALLGKGVADFGRYRNVFIEDDFIVVHTRNGGGNREDYEYVFEEMSEHPWYSHDEDDDFDCTYANIYFKVPEDVKQELANLNKGENPKEQWEKLLEKLKASHQWTCSC
jgi:hypothetical protein